MITHLTTKRPKRWVPAIWLALALALALLLALPLVLAHACTPPPGGRPAYTIADYINSAPVVFEGVIIDQSTRGGIEDDTVVVQVERYFQGNDGANSPATLTVIGFGPTSLCLVPVHIGQRLIFFADGDPNNGVLRAYYLSQFDAVRSVSDEVVAEIVAITGSDPVVPADAPTPLPARTQLPNDATVAARASNTPTPIDSALLTPQPVGGVPSRQVGQSAVGAITTVGFIGLLLGVVIGIVLGLRASRNKA